jgi:hypothetical protein|tara:strand:+ start:4367 stop:4759 length:393 start_codon:yes stop_codon:yes gene_type:complete
MSPITNLSNGGLASNSGAHDIVADQGATFTYNIMYADAKRKAHNVTGYTARMQLRATASSVEKVLELTTENGRIAVDGAAGVFTLYVSASDMTNTPPGVYVYDLEIEAPVTGFVERLMMGYFTVRSEVTR